MLVSNISALISSYLFINPILFSKYYLAFLKKLDFALLTPLILFVTWENLKNPKKDPLIYNFRKQILNPKMEAFLRAESCFITHREQNFLSNIKYTNTNTNTNTKNWSCNNIILIGFRLSQ